MRAVVLPPFSQVNAQVTTPTDTTPTNAVTLNDNTTVVTLNDGTTIVVLNS